MCINENADVFFKLVLHFTCFSGIDFEGEIVCATTLTYKEKYAVFISFFPRKLYFGHREDTCKHPERRKVLFYILLYKM